MTYWVYENTAHKKARIHKADCSFCGAGRGIHGGGKTISGNWHGPFQNFKAASAAAHQTKRDDIRTCNLCIGHGSPISSKSLEVNDPRIKVSPSTNRNSERELKCLLSLRWSPIGRLSLDDNRRVRLPPVEATAGLYKFSACYPNGRQANYIGESDNLRRRFGNYRNPGPTQQTSLRINAWLKKLLDNGGGVTVAITHITLFNGQTADLSEKAVRRLFENMAIALERAGDIESLNK
ncbi:hypothetical protein [Afipia felis]|uniref:GIY-YIG domain-containing protein n=2 Tax=Afipia felis TaxID=1035 RepID=A0A380W4C7_AFIFE|nr:hypothetical protein [Afipia felis]EKS30905.1 hypothetical protein HMPREF9697_03433 [Afipia felis ATCC 53690]SUU75649.1 Uncharacterised protein [Afipia felis]SUU83716.1 Uncharacterised protein [Afipia felis]